MRKHCSNVCKLLPCLDKESKNSAHMHTIMTTVQQRQYSQTELTFWIALVYTEEFNLAPTGLDRHQIIKQCLL